MQNKEYITSEITKNKEITYTSDVLKDILPEFSSGDKEKQSSILMTSNNAFSVTILKYSKKITKTNIKLLIKKNVLTDLILCNILNLKIISPKLEIFNIDFDKNKLIRSNIYLNSNEDTIINIKFLNEREN
mgnify:CR=1 FL=1|jgi:hypothetical protein